MNTPSRKPRKKLTAQAMVEFALALPVLLLIVYGLLETGRLLFMYASVVTAARQAARYGSASGDNGAGINYFNDCAGIRAAASRMGFIQQFQTITIAYDQGPGTGDIGSGCPIDPVAHPGHPTNGDRIRVTVRSDFSPIVPLVPFGAFTIESTDNRTLLTGVQIEVTPGGGGTGGNGALRIIKTADPITYTHVGQAITYHYSIQNDGTDPIDGPFTITDDKVGTVHCPGAPNPLPGGSGSVACNNATYLITGADITAASVTNTAYALNGDSSVLSNIVTVTITFEAAPEITLTKSGVAPSRIVAGQSIQYTFKITNSGNTPVTPPYTISDPLIGSNWTCPSTPNPLPAGGVVTCTGSYVLQGSDIGKMSITNTATATAQYGGNAVTSAPATATVLIPQLYLALTASPASVSAVGTSVTYTYSFTNRTNTAMTSISVADTRGTSKACLASLAAGATGSCNNGASYKVTQADLDSAVGYFANTAQGAATTPATTSNQASVNVTVLQAPSVTLTKTASPTLSSGQSWSAGQVITYTYALRNSGNVTITPSAASPLKIMDSDTRVLMAAACTVTSGTLAPGANLAPPCTGTLTLTDADIAAGSVTSTGTANGMFNSTALTASSTYTLVTFFGPRLSLVKIADRSYFTGAGETINYSYAIKNTGGQVLDISTSYSLTDNKIGSISCPLANKKATIQVGASIPCTGMSYTTTAADVAARAVQNTVTVQSGATTPATSPAPVSVTVPLLTCDATHPATTPNTPIVSGLNTNWSILNNTGTELHITGATITWTGGNLSQVLLTPAGGAGQSVWSGSTAPNGTISLPTAGWPSLPYDLSTPSVMTLRFEGVAGATIRVSLTFQESVGGTSCSITSP